MDTQHCIILVSRSSENTCGVVGPFISSEAALTWVKQQTSLLDRMNFRADVDIFEGPQTVVTSLKAVLKAEDDLFP